LQRRAAKQLVKEVIGASRVGNGGGENLIVAPFDLTVGRSSS